jgi:hypothetical protein
VDDEFLLDDDCLAGEMALVLRLLLAEAVEDCRLIRWTGVILDAAYMAKGEKNSS